MGRVETNMWTELEFEWQDSRGSDGDVVVLYRLPRPAPDDRTVIRLSPLELLDRLAARPACGGCPTDPFSIRDVLSHLGEPEPIPDYAPRGAHEMDQTCSW